ncbi:hypothetical protein G6F57_018112 [Rhizopus arrhizus]|nr:hypothetical protein G6F57_018112 [Rhizopus arrhizus]
MLQDDLAFRQALGPRRAHVVVAQHVQHAGADEAGDQRGIHQAQHHGGQDQVRQARGQRCIGAAIARHGQPAQLHRENLHQQQAQPEARHAGGEHRERQHRLIQRGAAFDGGQDPHRQRDGAGDQERHQRQQDRRFRAVGQRRQHGLVHEDGLAQVALRQLAQPRQVLDRHGLVQPQLRAQRGDVLLAGLRTQHHRGGVARRDADDDEHDGRDDEHHGHQPDQPV